MGTSAHQNSRVVICAFPGNETMAAALAKHLSAEYTALALRRFPDGESHVQFECDVSGCNVLLVCTLDRRDAKLARLVFAADAARDLGAVSVGLVAPYLAYMRQDRRFQPGEAVTSHSFARVLSASVEWLVTVDPHLPHFSSLDAVYTVPAMVVHAARAVSQWIRSQVKNPLIIGPDSESVQWVDAVAVGAKAPYLVLEKTRRGDRNVEVSVPDVECWRDLAWRRRSAMTFPDRRESRLEGALLEQQTYMHENPFVQTPLNHRFPWYVRLFFWNQRRRYGAVLEPARLWGRSPKVFAALATLYGALDRRSSMLEPALRSLVTVRVSQINWCAFCVDINSATVLKRGIEQAKLAELADFDTSERFTEREKAALSYAEAITYSNQQTSAEHFSQLRAHFDDDAVVELTALIAFQNLSSKFNAVLGVAPQGFCTQAPQPQVLAHRVSCIDKKNRTEMSDRLATTSLIVAMAYGVLWMSSELFAAIG